MFVHQMVILLSYVCLGSISAAMVTPALVQIETYFALGHGGLEWVVSIYLAGYVIGQLLYGPLANRMGCLAALRLGILVNCIGALICVFAVWLESFGLLLCGRLVTALGGAAGLVCTFIGLNSWCSKNQIKRMMSFVGLSFTIGIGGAVTIGGLIAEYLQWHYCFYVLLGHGVIMYGLTWALPNVTTTTTQVSLKRLLKDVVRAFKNPVLSVFSLVVGLASSIGYGYSVAAPVYSQVTLNLSPDLYAYWNLLNISGMCISGFLSAYLMARLKPQSIILMAFCGLSLCLSAFSLLVLKNTTHCMGFFGASMGLFLFGGLLHPSASYFASNAINDKATAASVMSFINMVSAMLAVMVIGYLPFASIVGFCLMLMFYGFIIIPASLWLIFGRRRMAIVSTI